MTHFNLVDLFSGGGGASCGYHLAGFKTEFAVDKAQHCLDTFNINFNNVAHNYNINQLRSEEILNKLSKKPNLVTASPPCEPFTLANQNRIKNPYDRLFSDDTGRLMLHAIRLIADLDPKFYVIENVKGILDGDGKELIRDEICRLGLDEPYFNYINAAEWGVPSNRIRVFITNFRLKSPKYKKKTIRDAISDLPPPNYPNEIENHITPSLNQRQEKKIVYLPPGEGLVYYHGALGDLKNFIRLEFDKIAPVVMGKSRFVHPTEDRLLTPRENARLMTFPDNFQFIGSMNHVYDIIGEAIPPKIAFEIGKQIISLI